MWYRASVGDRPKLRDFSQSFPTIRKSVAGESSGQVTSSNRAQKARRRKQEFLLDRLLALRNRTKFRLTFKEQTDRVELRTRHYTLGVCSLILKRKDPSKLLRLAQSELLSSTNIQFGFAFQSPYKEELSVEPMIPKLRN